MLPEERAVTNGKDLRRLQHPLLSNGRMPSKKNAPRKDVASCHVVGAFAVQRIDLLSRDL
jgi:hypothetical protein